MGRTNRGRQARSSQTLGRRTRGHKIRECPVPTPGDKAKGRRKKKKGQRPEVPATAPVTEVLAPDKEILLTKVADVFPRELPKGVPPPRPTDHRNMLPPNTLPPRHCLYRVPITQQAELKRQFDELLAAGHIEWE